MATSALVGLCVASCLQATSGVFTEAPELARAVASGALPPVEQRLPPNPQIVQPTESTGVYGGELRMAVVDWGDLAWIDRTMDNESLVRWDPQWTTIIPNLAQSWTVNSNATEYVFHLRRGVHWSDGALFTADDILFWYEEVFASGISRPNLPWLSANGKPVRVEKRDDYTVAFSYAAPNGLLLYGLAGMRGDDPVAYPRHYLAPFHPRLNPEGLPALMKQAGVTNNLQLFRDKVGLILDRHPTHRSRAPELPRLCAWQLVPGHGYGQTNTIEAVRNPYFWKVDTSGHQLPYIDRLVYTCVTNASEAFALALAGRIDLGERSITAFEYLPALREHMREGGYHFTRIITDSGNLAAICLNLTTPDPVKRALYRNKDFRIGLSHAIDRERIIREILKQPAEARQVAPRPESLLYHERLARQYTEFDQAKANMYLDRAGLTNKDAAGWRLGPDGAKVTITADMSAAHGIRIAAMKRVSEDWAKVGIDLVLRVEGASRVNALRMSNQYDAMVWSGDGGLDVVMDPRYYVPISEESLFAAPWAHWMVYPADRRSEKPPESVVRQMMAYREVQAMPDAAGRQALMRRVLDMAADEFYVIGLCSADDISCLVSDRLHNVPMVMMSSGRGFLAPAPVNPCQFFIASQEAGRP